MFSKVYMYILLVFEVITTVFKVYIQCFQTRREEKPKKERVEHYRPQGEEFDKAYTYHQQSRTDETVMSEGRVKSEKNNCQRRRYTRSEETEKPTYPKAIDIGRIVIDELPEENQPLQKRDIPKREKVKETRLDIEPCDKFDGRPITHVKEDAVKVGRINITDHETTQRKSYIQNTTNVICPSL